MSDDFSSSSGESGGFDWSSFLFTEKGSEGSDSDIDASGDVNLSGDGSGFIEEPVGVVGRNFIGVPAFNKGNPLEL